MSGPLILSLTAPLLLMSCYYYKHSWYQHTSHTNLLSTLWAPRHQALIPSAFYTSCCSLACPFALHLPADPSFRPQLLWNWPWISSVAQGTCMHLCYETFLSNNIYDTRARHWARRWDTKPRASRYLPAGTFLFCFLSFCLPSTDCCYVSLSIFSYPKGRMQSLKLQSIIRVDRIK